MKYIAWLALAFLPFSAFGAEQTVSDIDTNGSKAPWSLNFGWSQVVGSGTFSGDSHVRAVSDYVGQSFELGVSYTGLEVLDNQLDLSIRSSMDVEFTAPTHGGRRRVTFNDTRLSLSLPALYTESWSGIELGLNASLTLPTSVTSYRVKKQWLVATVGTSATGSWGILEVDLTLRASKYMGSTIGAHYGLLPAGCGVPTSAGAEEFTPNCNPDMVQLQEGFANVSVSLASALTLSVELFDHLSLSYGLGVRSYFKYSLPEDELTSVNAIGGLRRLDYFSPSWSISYPLSKKIELPFEMSVYVDASAFHSVRTADDKAVFLPLVFNTFGTLAANGYGSLSLGFSGRW